MATISITSGGIAARTGTHANESAPKTEASNPTPPEPIGDPERATSLPRAEEPTSEDLQVRGEAEMKELVAEMQSALAKASREPLNVGFRPDDRAGGFVIEIRTGNGDVIKQFPPEKVLNMRTKLDELSGMVIDEMT